MKYLLILCLMSFGALAETVKIDNEEYNVVKLTEVGNVLWGFDFINDEEMILNSRRGKMFKFNLKTKKQIELSGLPQNIYTKGQGGLLDVFFYKDRIYFTFSEDLGDKKYTSTLMSAKVEGDKLADSKILLRTKTNSGESIHFGSRVLVRDDVVYMSIGDRNKREQVQDLNFHNGKVLRMNLDGSPHKENPFLDKGEEAKYVYTYGHRNPQGLCFDSEGQLYEVEFGPRGGDEINLIKKGANYGWPVVTYGREYWGPKIGEGTEKEGVESPLKYYVPSISPSGCAFYRGNLYLANLSGKHIRRVKLEKQKFKSEEILLDKMDKRFRMIREGRDGRLYFSTDDGELFVLENKA